MCSHLCTHITPIPGPPPWPPAAFSPQPPPHGTHGARHARALPPQCCHCPAHFLLPPAAAYQEDCVLGQMPGDGASDLVGRGGCDSFSPILPPPGILIKRHKMPSPTSQPPNLSEQKRDSSFSEHLLYIPSLPSFVIYLSQRYYYPSIIIFYGGG